MLALIAIVIVALLLRCGVITISFTKRMKTSPLLDADSIGKLLNAPGAIRKVEVETIGIPGGAGAPAISGDGNAANFIGVDGIPGVVDALRKSAKQDDTAMLIHIPAGDTHGQMVKGTSITYSKRNGVAGLEWTLEGAGNPGDKERLTTLAASHGCQLEETDIAGLRVLRFTGAGIDAMGARIFQDFYNLPPEARFLVFTGEGKPGSVVVTSVKRSVAFGSGG